MKSARSPHRKPARVRNVVMMVTAALIACEAGNSGTGCGCDDTSTIPYPDPPPVGGELQSDVVRARLTQGVLDFLGGNLGALLEGFLEVNGDRGRFPLDGLTFINGLSFRPGSAIEFDLQALNDSISLFWVDGATPSDPPRLRFEADNLGFFLDAIIAIDITDPVTLQAACQLQETTTMPAVTIDSLAFEIELAVDSSGALPTFSGNVPPESIEVSLLNATDNTFFAFESVPCDGSGTCAADPLCTSSDCASLCSTIDLFADLGGFLAGVLEPVVQALAPDLSAFVSDALIAALESFPLGVETELDLSTSLGSVFSGAQPLALKVVGDDDVSIQGASAGRGLDLGLIGGASALAAAQCSAGVSPPDLAALRGAPPNFSGFVEVPIPGTMNTQLERYHLALTASQALITQATWAAFQSGLLCFNLEAEDVSDLAGSSFALTAGLLLNFDARLAGITSLDAPMLVQVALGAQPTVRLGTGGPVSPTENDPLIEIGLTQTTVGLYMQLDDTQQRVAELQADILLRLNIERAPDNSLEIVVEDFALNNLQQTYNELAPAADVAGLLELVVDIALDTFLGDSLRFNVDIGTALGDALGVPIELRINTIKRDEGPTGARFLSVYGTLCSEDDLTNPGNPACYVPPMMTSGGAPRDVSTLVALGDEDVSYEAPDPTVFDPLRFIGVPTGQVQLQTHASQDLEYQVRVDGGSWRGFESPRADGTLLVASPKLRAHGVHLIDLRARVRGQYWTRGDVHTLPVWIDRERPTLTAFVDDGMVTWETEDLGSPRDVQVWHRVRDPDAHVVLDWTRADGALNVGELTANYPTATLELVARDLSGNSSWPATIDLVPLSFATETVASFDLPQGGCSSTKPNPVFIVLVLPALWLRRRRR